MRTVVVARRNGTMLSGMYDGYGRVSGSPINPPSKIMSSVSAYHDACWRILSRPSGYTMPSTSSYDQGLRPEGEPQLKEPKTKRDLVALRKISRAQKQAQNDETLAWVREELEKLNEPERAARYSDTELKEKKRRLKDWIRSLEKA
jgi:hypothetical protein